MSKMKYKIEVYSANSTQIRISSEVELMVPGTFPFGESDWKTDKWDENSRSPRLIRAIADAKKFAFVTFPDTQSKYWGQRYTDKEEIGMVMIKVIGNGFTKRVHLYDVKVIPLSQFPVGMSANFVCFGYTLQLKDSDIDDNWSLNN